MGVPGEALLVAFLLAVVPYVLIRGPVSRIARIFLRRENEPRPCRQLLPRLIPEPGWPSIGPGWRTAHHAGVGQDPASLISFGFTIYKFFQLEISKLVPDRPEPLIGPREFAMILIATGIGSLILAFVEHRRSDRQLRETFGDIVPRSVAGIVASIVGGLGALAIIVVIFRQ